MKKIHVNIGRLAAYMLIMLTWNIYSYSAFGDRIVFMDVGQGDSALISIGDQDILIDGGPYTYLNHKLDRYKKRDTVIEYMIITHAHDDHYLGLLEVPKRYNIQNLVINPICQSFELFNALTEALKPENIIYSRYIKFIFDSENNNFEKINKDYQPGIKDEKCLVYQGNINNSSIIVEFQWHNKSFLFMGDSEQDREEELVLSGLLPDPIYLLKGGHHCSDTSTSDMFLREVSLRYVVCSYGKNNKYGHPSKDLLRKFKENGITVFETEKLGDIIINLSP